MSVSLDGSASLARLRGSWASNVRADLLAGLVVALALIPEAISFAVIAGVDPKVALYASFSMAVIVAITGGRPVMISAATASMALVIVHLVRDHGVEYLFAATVLTGVVQVALGLLGAGRLMRFVPRPVMVGFVNALTIMIFLAQLPNLTHQRWPVYAMVVGGLAVIYLFPRLTRTVPSPLVAIIAVAAIAAVFRVGVPTVGDKGELPHALPVLAGTAAWIRGARPGQLGMGLVTRFPAGRVHGVRGEPDKARRWCGLVESEMPGTDARPVVAVGGEAEAGVEVGDERVLRGWMVIAAQRAGVPPAGGVDEQTEHLVLEGSPDDAAAEQPGVDVGERSVQARDKDADEAVVAEAVGEADADGEDVGVGGRCADVGLAAAAAGEVELVRLVDQLGDAGDGDLVEGDDGGCHVQVAQEAVQVVGVPAELGGPGPGLVLSGTVPVGRHERGGLEVGVGGEGPDVVVGVDGEVQDVDLGEHAADQGAFGRVVVDEDEGVQPDAQGVGDLADLGRLVVPAGGQDGDVAGPQPHVGMVGERIEDVRPVVLRADGEDDAALAQLGDVVLEGGERLAERPAPRVMPARPSSPRIPPHRVLSRSRTRHLRLAPSRQPRTAPV